MVLVVLVSENHLNSGGFEKAQLTDGFFFCLCRALMVHEENWASLETW